MDTAAARACFFLLPGDWRTPTGGFRYDRRLAEALADLGWRVEPCRLDGAWPWPDADTSARAAAAVQAMPDGSVVVADGLAFGVLDRLAAEHADRLRWVALVHHPLHLETGLAAADRQRLLDQETRALAWARQVVVTSPRTALDVAAMGVPADRIAVVEPGTDARRPMATGPGDPGGATRPAAVRLLCVATVTPRKGHGFLLRALSGLLDLSWVLHCVGSLDRDPATAQEVQALARALRLDGRVLWHGEVDDDSLQAQQAAADLLVLPSLHEGYGMAVAEALAAGLPVLASQAGALAQTLPPEAGWQVPPGDVQALEAALRRLIGEPALRRQLAEGAARAGRRLPGWPAQAARFAAVLEALP